jgi:hypothetical protein
MEFSEFKIDFSFSRLKFKNSLTVCSGGSDQANTSFGTVIYKHLYEIQVSCIILHIIILCPWKKTFVLIISPVTNTLIKLCRLSITQTSINIKAVSAEFIFSFLFHQYLSSSYRQVTRVCVVVSVALYSRSWQFWSHHEDVSCSLTSFYSASVVKYCKFNVIYDILGFFNFFQSIIDYLLNSV